LLAISPEAVIIAGPNGSGKTTLIASLPEYGISIPDLSINPDVIERHLREKAPDDLSSDVSRMAFHGGRRLRQEYREKRVSFVLETVFSHPSGLLDLQRLRDAGYRVTLAVVTTCDPEINVLRVAERVKTGGHAVAGEKIRERYDRFMRLLPRMVEMAASVFVFDSSETTRLCYKRERFPVAVTVPDYLQSTLLEPLAAREQARVDIVGLLAPGEQFALPDEASGSYEGTLRASMAHYALQETKSGHFVQHDQLLFPNQLPQVGRVHIAYMEGVGSIQTS